MTTTNLYSGYNEAGKSSSRVLQPPGGGSSNIFGGPEPTPQQQANRAVQQQYEGEQQQQYQGGQQQQYQGGQQQQYQGGQQHGGGANPHMDAKEEYQRNKPKGRAEAPFASFDESGKHSRPTQFDKCDDSSQNDADFRSYSVTAYRDALAQNQAIKLRASGQAAGSFNPITHAEGGNESNQQPQRPPHQQQSRPAPVDAGDEQPRRMVRGQNNQPKKVQYNPITGEEYPADYGQQNEEDNKGEEAEKTTVEDSDSQNARSTPTETPTEAAPSEEEVPAQEEVNTLPAPKPTSVRVRQPPGGKSSGLW
ncbi:protein kinase 4-like [Mya arenaria]|uniref:protein kinase 4-like n=1 Tax=Mya arenaria TaxID=6604 RepID=UPI0022E6F317|nr:protein kinase 4-like [Mya arenaria]